MLWIVYCRMHENITPLLIVGECISVPSPCQRRVALFPSRYRRLFFQTQMSVFCHPRVLLRTYRRSVPLSAPPLLSSTTPPTSGGFVSDNSYAVVHTVRVVHTVLIVALSYTRSMDPGALKQQNPTHTIACARQICQCSDTVGSQVLGGPFQGTGFLPGKSFLFTIENLVLFPRTRASADTRC